MAKLPDTASISDIIKALTEVEAINQKADLVSVVGGPATSGDNVATVIQKLQNAKNTLANNISNKGGSATGTESLQTLANKVASIPTKRWATGTVTIPGSTGQTNTVTISGLLFVPTMLIALSSSDPSSNNPIFHGYMNTYAYNDTNMTGAKTWKRLDNNSTSMFINQLTAPTTGQFKLTNTLSSNYTDYVRWIAFE
ncbi:tail fiber protein [Brevibacillus phage Abouo]|uniref:Tail fiber protein n=2 Tax=Abouovirus TaxID=1984773 RepID=S5MAE6_9CAUD|nr:tail fiber protein [Brevibacillus phage Davies]YP_009220088.1 tail fiber protein [Brevibacillus phage Abouo]AGR47471.1 tail fiber protein [Brevibacillus phage Abouo]AGR47563.1 tail fiber protein [Brevibacillus phage Davies]